MSLKDVPWYALKRSFYNMRRLGFTKDKRNIQVRAYYCSLDELETIFRKEHFQDGRLFSFHYKGEDLNLYRPEYEDDNWEAYQTHVRFFKLTDNNGRSYIGLDLHYELNPREDGQELPHLKGVNNENEEAIENVEEIFKEHRVDYKLVNYNG